MMEGVSLKPEANRRAVDEPGDKPEPVTALARCHANGRVCDLNTGGDSVHFAFDVDYDFMTSELFRHLSSLFTSPDCLTLTPPSPSATA